MRLFDAVSWETWDIPMQQSRNEPSLAADGPKGGRPTDRIDRLIDALTAGARAQARIKPNSSWRWNAPCAKTAPLPMLARSAGGAEELGLSEGGSEGMKTTPSVRAFSPFRGKPLFRVLLEVDCGCAESNRVMFEEAEAHVA